MDLLRGEYKAAYTQFKEKKLNTFPWGSHQPLLIHVLNTIKTGKVLELGIGYNSTPIMNMICGMQGREMVSVETNLSWYNKFKSYKGVNHDMQFIEHKVLLKEGHKVFDDKYSVAFIDSHQAFRQSMIIKMKDNVDYFVVHDTECVVYGKTNCYKFDFSMFKHAHHFTSCTPMTSVISNLDEINPNILDIFKNE